MRLRHSDIKGNLSREAITRYASDKRSPQRTSLEVVSQELMQHYNTLCAYKKKLDAYFSRARLLNVLQHIRNKTYIPWKSIAASSGVDTSTLYLWVSSKVQPSEKIYTVARSVLHDYTAYSSLCASDCLSPQTLRIEGKEIAAQLGVREDFIYPYLRGERSEASFYAQEIKHALASLKENRKRASWYS